VADTVETLYIAKGNHEAFIKSLTEEQKKYIKTTKKADESSKKLSKAIGGLSVALIAKRAIGAVAKETIAFEKGMSNVKALLKPTSKEFELLSSTARELGKTTAFSAMQSAEAFAELGKLGFKTNQILASSADVLNLAAAANTNMATAAEVTAKTINQFNLEAEEAGRVTDVIAKASSSSAVDIYNFQEAMKIAGATSKGMNVQLEESTAAISALADGGIEGTMAGTGLSRVLLELGNSGSKVSKILKQVAPDASTLTEKLKALKKANLSTTQVFDAFGKIAGKSALTLINNADKVDRLTDSYQDASGAAKEMADVQLDNMDGALKLLKSASSELAISLGELFSPALRAGIDATTWTINAVAEATQFWSKAADDLIDNIVGGEADIKNSFESSARSIKTVFSAMEEMRSLRLKANEENRVLNEAELDRWKKLKIIIRQTSGHALKFEEGIGKVAGRSIDQLKAQHDQILENKKARELAAKDVTEEKEEQDTGDSAVEANEKAKEAIEARLNALEMLRANSIAHMNEEDQAKQKIIDNYKEILSNETVTAEERVELEKQRLADLTAVHTDFTNKRLEAEQEAADKLAEQKKEALEKADEESQKQREKEIDNIKAWAGTIESIYTGVTSVISAQFNRKENILNADVKNQIKAVKATTKTEEQKEKAIAKIEERAAKERKDLRLKEWRANLIMSIANTALGVTKTMATMGYPAGIPFAIAAGASGAASTAVIAANKPRFALGSVNAFGQTSEIGTGSGIGGVDSQLALVSPDEIIVKPKDTAVVKDALNGGGSNKGVTNINFSPVFNFGSGVEDGDLVGQFQAVMPEFQDLVVTAIEGAKENNKFDESRVSI
jgi:TP901 family phage tail tape measure protein